MSGSIWYEKDGKIVKVSNGGQATPAPVADVRLPDNRISSYFPRISRKSPRYLQLGNYVVTSSQEGSLLQVYDHASNQPYCFVNVSGFTSLAYVSPSGNYLGMRRSPEVQNDRFGSDANSIAGLTIVDISNPNDIRAVRTEYLRDGDAVVHFAWLEGDRFLYIDKRGTIVTGSAGTDSTSDRVVGPLDARGMVGREFDVHPDGATMLIRMLSADGSYDIYLYGTNGQALARMTSTGQSYAPLWSPDGNHFMFKWGSSAGCAPVGGCAGGGTTCSGFYAPASARSLGYSDAAQFDVLKVNCLNELYWSSIA
jgi:Tol biopolymer transport system component